MESCSTPFLTQAAVAQFSAARLLRSPHFQTLVAAAPVFLGENARARAQTEQLRIVVGGAESKGTLAAIAHYPLGTSSENPRPVVVLVHGIGGSSESRYVLRAASAFLDAGFAVVRLNLRGAGGSHVHIASMYHVGLGEDLDDVVNFLATDPRTSGVFLCGFSGGGNVVLKRAGEWGKHAPAALRGVAALGAPVDLAAASKNLHRARNYVYHSHVLKGLKATALALATAHPKEIHYTHRSVQDARTLSEFDAVTVVPMHGFGTVERYYRIASAMNSLSNIEVPAIVLHADDDPMVPGATVRPAYAKLPPHVRKVFTEHGGHLGWVDGLREDRWVRSFGVAQVIEYFAGQ